jgi:hypothetical protein
MAIADAPKRAGPVKKIVATRFHRDHAPHPAKNAARSHNGKRGGELGFDA